MSQNPCRVTAWPLFSGRCAFIDSSRRSCAATGPLKEDDVAVYMVERELPSCWLAEIAARWAPASCSGVI